MSKKIFIDTLGCAKNEYDSQNLAAQLLERGCGLADSPEEADILIVNTCGFIEAAKVESIEHIFSMAALKGESKKLVVTGCLSERYHEDLSKEIPEVDLFTGVNDYDDLPGLLLAESTGDKVQGEVEAVLPYRKRVFPEGTYTASLKIAEGCNNTCAFCAIPMNRAPYRSKRIEDCVREAEDMAAAGVQELVVIAQDTSYYGKDLNGKAMLPELLHELCKVDGIRWIRLMYVYDDGITDELIETMKQEDKICNYIDIPIQHVADPVLKGMRRKSTGDSIRKTIAKLRKEIPDIHIRTTILVGFPGETEEDFLDTLSLVREVEYDSAFTFIYSPRVGTPAAKYDNQIPENVKHERFDRLVEEVNRCSAKKNSEYLGRIVDVMVDGPSKNDAGAWSGRTDTFKLVNFTSEEPLTEGQMVSVRMTETKTFSLDGEKVDA